MNQDSLPYPGLRPYREDEYHKFFGRQADAEILIDKLLTNRLTLLFAASGVGSKQLREKISLLPIITIGSAHPHRA